MFHFFSFEVSREQKVGVGCGDRLRRIALPGMDTHIGDASALFNLVPEKEVINTISNVTESLSSEWEIFSNSYVWNYSDKGYLVDKRVKWANVEMIEV